MSNDIVQRLRDGLEQGAIDLADIMDAADEIQRLRLTPEEIAALSWFTGGRGPVCPQYLSTIRGIIEKHSPQPAAENI